jgi:hypothetical protein
MSGSIKSFAPEYFAAFRGIEFYSVGKINHNLAEQNYDLSP